MSSFSFKSENALDRRDLVKATAATAAGVIAGAFGASPAAAQETKIEAQDRSEADSA